MPSPKRKARNQVKAETALNVREGHGEKPLDLREQRFVDEFMISASAEKAALAAGYAAGTARTDAYDWVNRPEVKPHVYAEIQRRRAAASAKLQAKADVSMEFVRREWMKIAGLNVHDLFEVGADGKIVVDAKGNPKIDWTKLTPAQAAAICEIDPSTGKVKFTPKDGVLRDLARHLGGFAKDAPQVTVSLTLEQLILMSMQPASDEGEKIITPQIEHQR